MVWMQNKIGYKTLPNFGFSRKRRNNRIFFINTIKEVEDRDWRLEVR